MALSKGNVLIDLTDLRAAANSFDDVTFKQLFNSVIGYCDSRLSDDFDPGLELGSGALYAFNNIKAKIDLNEQAYKKKCEKNRKNGKVRWSSDKDAIASDRMRSHAKQANYAKHADTETDIDSDSEDVSESDIDITTPIPPPGGFVGVDNKNIPQDYNGISLSENEFVSLEEKFVPGYGYESFTQVIDELGAIALTQKIKHPYNYALQFMKNRGLVKN